MGMLFTYIVLYHGGFACVDEDGNYMETIALWLAVMVVVLIVLVVVAALKQKLVTANYTPLANFNFKFLF